MNCFAGTAIAVPAFCFLWDVGQRVGADNICPNIFIAAFVEAVQ